MNGKGFESLEYLYWEVKGEKWFGEGMGTVTKKEEYG